MHRFRRDPACFQAWLQPLRPDQAPAALWLAGRLQMPALQQAAAARLHALHPGEESAIRIVDLQIRNLRIEDLVIKGGGEIHIRRSDPNNE